MRCSSSSKSLLARKCPFSRVKSIYQPRPIWRETGLSTIVNVTPEKETTNNGGFYKVRVTVDGAEIYLQVDEGKEVWGTLTRATTLTGEIGRMDDPGAVLAGPFGAADHWRFAGHDRGGWTLLGRVRNLVVRRSKPDCPREGKDGQECVSGGEEAKTC